MNKQDFHNFYGSAELPVKVYHVSDGSIIPVMVTSYDFTCLFVTEKAIGYRLNGKRCVSSVDFFHLTVESARKELSYDDHHRAPVSLFALEQNTAGLIHGAKEFKSVAFGEGKHSLILVDKYGTEVVLMSNSGNLSYEWAVPHLNALFIGE